MGKNTCETNEIKISSTRLVLDRPNSKSGTCSSSTEPGHPHVLTWCWIPHRSRHGRHSPVENYCSSSSPVWQAVCKLNMIQIHTQFLHTEIWIPVLVPVRQLGRSKGALLQAVSCFWRMQVRYPYLWVIWSWLTSQRSHGRPLTWRHIARLKASLKQSSRHHLLNFSKLYWHCRKNRVWIFNNSSKQGKKKSLNIKVLFADNHMDPLITPQP